MNNLIVQNLRDKLQKRFHRLNSVQKYIFPITLQQFFTFLDNDVVFKSIIEEVLLQHPQDGRLNRDPQDLININHLFGLDNLIRKTASETAAIAYSALIWLSKDTDTQNFVNKIAQFGQIYQWRGDLENYYDNVKKLFLDPLCEYLDEKLETQRVMLSLLLRYKHRSEWFYRNKLWQLYNEKNQKPKKPEKRLALDLYAYLFEQGLEFTIEPSSIDGAIDLIAAQNSDDPLLADAKIFSSNKTNICTGFGQVYRYTQKFNESFGYLVIYNATNKDLCFSLSTTQGVSYIIYNHKIVFFIVIDICEREIPSKSKKPHPITITEKDLIGAIPEETND